MSGLLGHIRDLIQSGGPISIANYMELALQHPEYGYYRQHDPLGKSGDFITAPEISQMFGEMLGLWCADTWHQIGSPQEFILFELGPGRGALMQDALRATAKIKGFHEAIKLYLLESSSTLRAAQEEKLGAHHPRYIESLSEIPALPILVIANEFFDALPVRQFEKTAQGWRERLITIEGDHLAFILSPPDPSFVMLIPEDRREADAGTIHEIAMPALSTMRDIAGHIASYNGAALVIDYGYAIPSGAGTLQAISGHQYADVLSRPGEIDITTHVDFSALKHIASAQNTRVFGPAGQGEFLQTLGIEVRAIQLKHGATLEQTKDIDLALRRLTDPSQMGTLFKAMGIASLQLASLTGF